MKKPVRVTSRLGTVKDTPRAADLYCRMLRASERTRLQKQQDKEKQKNENRPNPDA